MADHVRVRAYRHAAGPQPPVPSGPRVAVGAASVQHKARDVALPTDPQVSITYPGATSELEVRMSEQNENIEAIAEDDDGMAEDELGDAAKSSSAGGFGGGIDD